MKNYNLQTENKTVAGGLNELKGSINTLNDVTVVLSECQLMYDQSYTIKPEELARINELLAKGITPYIVLTGEGRSASCSIMDQGGYLLMAYIYCDDGAYMLCSAKLHLDAGLCEANGSYTLHVFDV